MAERDDEAAPPRGRHRLNAAGPGDAGAGNGTAEPGQPAALAPAPPGQHARGANGARPDLSRPVDSQPVASRRPASRPPASRPPASQPPARQPAASQPVNGQHAQSVRPDTLPDWRPELGRVQHRPAAKSSGSDVLPDAGPDAQPATGADMQPATGQVVPPATGLERLLSVRGWPLAVVLAIQAALSLRLVWSAPAFNDEAEYLTMGHLELAHFLQHARMPEVASFLSGSPVVYPPLAAIADNIGGLAAARLLSLIFMLIATVALHGVARRLLSSRTAAFFAAALFACLGPAQFLGAFATYDAMALALLALATWLGVRALEASSAVRYTLLCAGGLSIAVADAAKYASVLFNPVVIVVVVLAAWRADGRKAGLDAGGAMLLAAALPLTVGYDLAGRSYGQGITSTTLTRSSGTDSVRAVLALSAHATGIIAVLAVLGAGVITARRPGWPTVALAWALAAALAWALAAAEFLAPAEQARIHTLTSLFKHVGYGAWFACVIAGYLLAEIPVLLARQRRSAAARASGAGPRLRLRWAALLASTVVVVLAGAFGVTVANGQYGDWPNSRPMLADFTKLVRPAGFYLVEDPSIVTYYLRSKVQYLHVASTYNNFDYLDPQTGQMLTGTSAYADAIKRGYFNAIVLSFSDTFTLDQVLAQDISRGHDYRLVAVIRYRDSFGPSKYQIWQRVPARPVVKHRKHRR